MNYARLLGLLRDLIPLRVDETDRRQPLLDWTRKAHWAHKQRNSILHSALVRLNPEEERLIHFRFIPGEEEAMLEVVSFKAESLDYLADRMDEIAQEGLEFLPESGAKLRPPDESQLPTEDDAV